MKKSINLITILVILVMTLTSCSYVTDLVAPPDYKQITNDIFTNYIEMNLIVDTYSESVTMKTVNQGSGVIYGKDSHYYYCLTNAHVVKTAPTDKNVSYTITDCYGKKYNAYFVHMDESRDLAVLKFIASESLCIAELAKSNPKVDEEIVVLSASNHLINSVTYGKVLQYQAVNMYYDTPVQFPVIWHDAPIFSGSSGGAVLNLDMELVGLIFAGSAHDDGSFQYGFAIAIDDILDYLEENKLMK